jgi:pimeloyl-ACP methyl ester carboxylesterase
MIKKKNENLEVEFESRAQGDPKNQTIIILVGTGVSLNWGLIDKDLVKLGFYVITFNARDVIGGELEKVWDQDGIDWNQELNKAMSGQPFIAPYDWNDQADDVITVLDSYNIKKAHILGFSTGGTLAEVVMTRHPNRIQTAILGSSSYDFNHQPDPEYVEIMANLPAITPESKVDVYIERMQATIGRLLECSDNDIRRKIIEESARDDFNHGWLDVTGAGNARSALAFYKWMTDNLTEHYEALKKNEVPCLVIHGMNDPMVPFNQGELLASNTGNSTFLPHEYGHILGPLESQKKLLEEIKEFIYKTKNS